MRRGERSVNARDKVAVHYTRCPVPTATGIGLAKRMFDALYADTIYRFRDIAELGPAGADAHYTHSIEYCYRVAVPGKFHGNLGFELVQVFDSNPTIGPLSLNDQFAEEAFTVYDHPKVLIFKKTADYDPKKVENILGAVDFSQVIRLPPLKFESHPATLMLPEERWAAQQQGGNRHREGARGQPGAD
jgi:hypothetical protein